MPSPNLQTTGVDLSPTSPDGVQSTRRDTMNTVSPDVPSSRIIMFGLRCDFTEAVATGLTERGIPPAALLVPGHPQLERPVRVGAPPSALPIAGMPRPRPGSTYPTFQIGQIRASPTIDLIESLQPDVIVVACYPRLIPRMIREIPRLGSLNVHPSLLPAHRGPDPLFWIMRDGGDGCGVTVHELSDAFDAGDILAQQAVPYPDGSRERELELLLASVGAELVAEAVAADRARDPLRQRQDERSASYESWPSVDDFAISVNRPTRDAWNFVRGVAGRGLPVRIVDGSAELLVSDAVEIVQGSVSPVAKNAGEIVITFSDGWLMALKHPPFTD
jgi:methionyl-tRNA formyltransferase